MDSKRKCAYRFDPALRQIFKATRIMGQGDSARDFDTSESMKNAGILDVFPIFYTARLGQKIRRSLQLPPKRCCLNFAGSARADNSHGMHGKRLVPYEISV